jgi:ABC-type maltose transport system permease subunit
VILTGSTLITVPVMIVFIIVQHRLSSDLNAGAMKG